VLRAAITGTGFWVPPQVVTNDDLAARIDTSDAWITERSGIRERRWLARDADELPEPERQRYADALARSQRLSLLVEMRTELAALWQRSTATHEELVARLQEWCRRAEASGIRQLEEFSLRLRRYAL